jgi:hypothetical protein
MRAPSTPYAPPDTTAIAPANPAANSAATCSLYAVAARADDPAARSATSSSRAGPVTHS